MRGNISVLCSGTCLLLALVSEVSHADEKSYEIDVTTTNAVDALSQLASQTQYPLLFDYDQLKGIRVQKLRGRYTLQEALDLLLKDTGFKGILVNQEAISITPEARPMFDSRSDIGDSSEPDTLSSEDVGDGLLEEIIVTGSNIRRKKGYTGSAPLQVLHALDIERSGAQDLADVAPLLTANSGSITFRETGSLIGTSQFNIRGLGVGSTLTLINGRRGGVSTVSDATGVLFFDNKQLPLAMIERIDVQTDGASSIYGSDAVGGVVNIVTRKGFEGLELSSRHFDASNEALVVNLAAGVKADNFVFGLYATAYTQTRNHRTDFDWLVERIHGGGDLAQSRLTSAQGSPGSYRRATVVGMPSVDFSSATITESGARFADPDCLAANGVLAGGRCRYNFADQVSPVPEENRFQAFSEVELSVTSNLRFFAEASFSLNKIQRTQGPSVFRNGLVEDGDIFVPADHPFNFWIDDPGNPGGNLIYINPEDWDNSLHTAVDLVCECRPLGFEANGFDNNPPFNNDIDLNYYRGLAGFNWYVSANWSIRANYIYALAKRNFRSENNWNATTLNGAVLDGSFNPFGTSRVRPSLISPKDGVSTAENSDALIDFIQNIQRSTARSLQQVVDLTASGSLYDIGENSVAWAVGGQFRHVDHRTVPDALTAAGLGNNPQTFSGLDSSESVYAVFAELVLPVTNTLEVQIAVRREDYGGAVEATTDPKVSARWDIADWASLSGSWGTAFRGPSIPQIGRSSSSAFIDDPVTPGMGNAAPTCGGSGQSNIAIVRTEGSDNLRPELSENFNLGLALEPASGLRVQANYWHFNYRDLITADEGPQAIVENDCNDDGLPNDPRVIRNSEGQVSIITSEFINTGSVKTSGIDLAVNYTIQGTKYGDFNLRGALSYVSTFRVTNIDGTRFDGVGNRNFNNQFSSLPQVRANAAIDWNYGNHSLNIGLRYIDSYRNDQHSGFVIGSWTALDLQYKLDLNLVGQQTTSLSIGARNLFDAAPPSLGDGQRPAYDDRVHDIRGRTVYLGLTQKI